MNILVCGGAGYIGSHTCVELISAGHDILVADNLSNSSIVALERIKSLTGYMVPFYEIDIRNTEGLNRVFQENAIESVIHFAGLKAVGESVKKPLTYYQNNLAGTLSLLEAMSKSGVKKIVFSSSATVYGEPAELPIREDFPLTVTNPYGRSKLIIEEVLRDMYTSDPDWAITLLRYFNPVGAHKSGEIGEDPRGTPNNLMPYIAQVAVGRLEKLNIFGGDYPTPDGTGVRDYIHVVDLAKGHVKALEKMIHKPGLRTYNLGTGRGYSVLEMINAFEKVAGKKIPRQIVDRRDGDIAACYAAPDLAEQELGWIAELDLYEMCEDTWRWQTKNPKGYCE